MTDKMCDAMVSQPPHYTHRYRCTKTGRYEVGKLTVCGTHKRIAERWQAEGRLDSMAAFHWDWKLGVTV